MSSYRDAGGEPPQDCLAGLLAAAAAAPDAGELAGEEAALLAFRKARLADPPAPKRHSILAKVVTAKVVAVAAGLTVAGGAALAATGTVPIPVPGSGADPDPPAGTPVDRPITGTATPDPGGATPPGWLDRPGGAPPSPSLRRLCAAYPGEASGNSGKPANPPAFRALVRAAGGPDQVADYCADQHPDRVPRGQPGEGPGGEPGRQGGEPGSPGGTPAAPQGTPAAPQGTPAAPQGTPAPPDDTPRHDRGHGDPTAPPD